jgi:hypothetical protein
MGVDPLGVGLERGDDRRVQSLHLAFRQRREIERTGESVEPQGRRARHFRERAAPEAPRHLHLPEPVLRVQEAERPVGVGHRPGPNRRDAVRVADDLHLGRQPLKPPASLGHRQRLHKPNPEPAARQQEQQEEAEHAFHDPSAHGGKIGSPGRGGKAPPPTGACA